MAKKELEPLPLFSEAAERSIVGICLSHESTFWECYGKLEPAHFAMPRLARIWEAMNKSALAGHPPNRNRVPLFIRGDSKETTPLGVFLTVLINDAPTASEAEAYMETIIHLANKRLLLDSLETARAEILAADVGVPVEYMVDTGIRFLSNSVSSDYDSDMKTYGQWSHDVFIETAKAVDAGENAAVGLDPGLGAVKEVIGRLLPGKLYVLAGMSSSGKSAVARQIAEAAAEDAKAKGLGFGYIASLEMTGKEYATRSISQRLQLPSHMIEEGNVNHSELELIASMAQKLQEMPIIVDARTHMTIDMIKSRALRVKNRNGLALMIVDHLILVKGGPRDSLLDRVSNATIGAKNMAKELGIPVIMLAQLDEKKIIESASGWPNASHLFGGQTITQNADVVCFVHRPEIVLGKKEPAKDDHQKHAEWSEKMQGKEGQAWIFNDKRRGGKGKVERQLMFDGPTMTFREI